MGISGWLHHCRSYKTEPNNRTVERKKHQLRKNWQKGYADKASTLNKLIILLQFGVFPWANLQPHLKSHRSLTLRDKVLLSVL